VLVPETPKMLILPQRKKCQNELKTNTPGDPSHPPNARESPTTLTSRFFFQENPDVPSASLMRFLHQSTPKGNSDDDIDSLLSLIFHFFGFSAFCIGCTMT
jgi:hypothetical protein